MNDEIKRKIKEDGRVWSKDQIAKRETERHRQIILKIQKSRK